MTLGFSFFDLLKEYSCGYLTQRTKQEKSRQNDTAPLCRKAGISNEGYRSNCQGRKFFIPRCLEPSRA
jgi:hypothetical protein